MNLSRRIQVQARLCILLGVLMVAAGCLQHAQTISDMRISFEELARLKNVKQMDLLVHQSPSFLVALPTKRVRVGKLGIPFERQGLQDAVIRGRNIPALTWLGDPGVKLGEAFFPRWKQKAGLSGVSSNRRFIDSPATGYVEGSENFEALEIRVLEWGLYYHSDEDRYFFQLAGQARLLGPGYDNIRWAALCLKNTDPASLGEWTNEHGVMLKKELDLLIEKCVGDLMRQFVSQ